MVTTQRKLSSHFPEDNPETSTAEDHHEVQSPKLHGHRKQKKKKYTMSLGECENLETVKVDSEKDLSLFVNEDVRPKKKRKREKERNGSRSEGQCDAADVQNLRLTDHTEKKEKKKKKDKCVSLGRFDSSVMVDSDLILNNPLVGDDEKEQKKQRKEKHFSRSGAACDSLQLENHKSFGEQRKTKHHSRSVGGDYASQLCALEIREEKQNPKLVGSEVKQENNKNRHSCLAEEGDISKFRVETAKEKDCGVLLKGDDILGIPAQETLQSVQDPKSVDGKGGKKKRKHCSDPAESSEVSDYTTVKIIQQIENSVGKAGNQKEKERYSQSAEGGSETITGNPCKEGEILETADIDMDISPKKHKKKKKKKKMQCNTSLNDVEVLQKSVKKCKESGVLPFETVVEKNYCANSDNHEKSLKKHKVKCNASGISQNTAKGHSMTMQETDSAGIVAEQTEQAIHNSSTVCQEAVKISKKLKQKKGTLVKCKSSKTKNVRQDGPVHCSALSRENTLQVVFTPETIAKPNKILKTQKKQEKKWQERQHVIVSDDNIDNTSVKQSQEEDMPFGEDAAIQMSKSKLAELLKDFVPSVEKLTTGTLHSMYKYDLPRFEKFKEEGIPIRQGRFTKEENEQLKKNVKELMELTGIQTEWEFFHVPESFDEMMRIKQLKQNNLFCTKLAEGIPRPWKCVYQRAKKMFDPNRCKGRYTEEELEKLNNLRKIHGNHWIKIAKLMDRSDTSVLNRARLLKKSLKTGVWSKKEVRELMKIMEKIMKERIQELPHDLTMTNSDSNVSDSIFREHLYKNLPWGAIAEQMEHRNWLQCRQKWLGILTAKMSGRTMALKTNCYQNNINLIKRLYLLGVDDIGEVDWEELCSAVGDVPPLAIQRMFYRLKTRYVPNWSRKSFGAVVEFLHDYIIPKMEKVLCTKSQMEDIYQPQQHMFQLSDIFNENDNSDAEDEDDENEMIHLLKEQSVQTPIKETK
ncbi:transcription termination factor 1-like [Pristis pectinata]|uniref:transcription termination factor 1-like n=1 Tax=Pristis pectinata TaxID=685728 RepID=UPI00223D3F9C|nr:transcription termination factor 1-like [Pristis pectinata]XP_051893000.1 transcription termination factor 1-like [Pristis pectinata]XP_051893001.1 transcription termination factor 1-like [Pristis pectinata]XP_051893002.1 transcription termination factor 1-like [Pristis pectinata]XP_051893003.1 transcription termination factor 1-like [Pristis pectinata]